MMGLYSFTTILIIAFAIFFYRAARTEDQSGVLWVVLSVAISLVTWKWFGWGLLGIILGQVGLFVGIGLVRTFRKT